MLALLVAVEVKVEGGKEEYGKEESTERIRLPMPRDLKLPEGWRFSSLRKIRLMGKGC